MFNTFCLFRRQCILRLHQNMVRSGGKNPGGEDLCSYLSRKSFKYGSIPPCPDYAESLLPPLLLSSLSPLPLAVWHFSCFLLLYASALSPAFTHHPGMALATGREGTYSDQNDSPPQIGRAHV